MRIYRTRCRLALMVFLSVLCSFVAVPIASATATPPVPWIHCSQQQATSGNYGCLDGYGSYGYAYGPVSLSAPGALTLSKSACPPGTPFARSGEYCSGPFSPSLALVDFSKAYGVGVTAVSETNANSVITLQPVPGTPATTSQFCSDSASGYLGEVCTGASAPIYAVESRAPLTDTMALCGAGHLQGGGFFEDCMNVTLKRSSALVGGLRVSLAGKKATAPNTITVAMTLTNTGSSDISGLRFTAPSGLENDGVLITKGNIGPTRSGLTLQTPAPAPPSSLRANGSPVVLNYSYKVDSAGDAVLVANATGTDAGGHKLSAKQSLTVIVTNPPRTEADYDDLVTAVLLDADSIGAQGQNMIASTEADSLASGLKIGAASPGQQAGAVALGLPTQMGVLFGTVANSALGKWVGNYSATLAADLKGGVSYLGHTGSALASQLAATVTDPVARAAALGRLWDGIQSLPAKTRAALASQSANLGYFGDALVAATTPQGQTTALMDNAAAGASAIKSLQTNVAFAVSGFPAVVAADNAAYAHNPTAFINAESKQYADATYGLIKTEITTLLGDGIAKGIGAAAKAGISLATSSTKVDAAVAAAVDSSAPAASDSTAALIQNADAATSQFQALPAGTPLAANQVTQLGGLTPGDQVGFQKALDYIHNKFGVQLEVGARTSEPLSVGINGSPKLSFMKPKAVSSMDMMMGAPTEIPAYAAPGNPASGKVFNGGVTTVFNPVPLPPNDLAAIADVNPEFEAAYKSRLASQQKLWADYQDPNSTLRVLVQGSEDAKGSGVTAISSIPGHPVPAPPAGAQPLIYLEQLDQPGFQAKWNMTESQAQSLKTSLQNSPGAVRVDYIARPNSGGSISFFDGLANNAPFVSDLDLQYVQPANGAPWPPGLQTKIQTEFQIQLKQNLTRLPDHGASGSASDLPAANIQVADSFVLATSDPEVAKAVAANLARRYASQSAIFSSNAARLDALAAQTSDPVKAQELRAQAASYRKTAAQFATVDAAYLRAKYPPGEKIIVIKLGDVRVGYGPGPKT